MTDNIRQKMSELLDEIKIEELIGSECTPKGQTYLTSMKEIACKYQKKLYRYRNISNNTTEDLKTDIINCSFPSNFNDPYDTLYYFDEAFVDKFYNDNKTRVDNVFEQIIDFYKDKNDDGRRFINAENKKICEKLIIKNGVENISKYDFYKATTEENQKLLINTAQKNMKVACFSETYNSILMWSHYGRDHTGFCIGYDFDKLNKLTNIALLPIIYTEQRYNATTLLDNALHIKYNQSKYSIGEIIYNRIITIILGMYKCNVWNYESEWRLFNPIDNKEPIKICPSEIYLGAKISESDEKEIIKISKEKNIKIFKMEVTPYQEDFQLVAKHIEE